MIKYILFFIIIAFLFSLIENKLFKNKYNNNNIYSKKNLMTNTEYLFYLKLKDLEDIYNYKIIPQINLASIIKKNNNSYYYNDLFRNIDFALLSSDYSEVLLLIELNDKSHKLKKRRQRDLKVEKICKSASIPLIKFYTSYSNEKDYVIDRILKTINSD